MLRSSPPPLLQPPPPKTPKIELSANRQILCSQGGDTLECIQIAISHRRRHVCLPIKTPVKDDDDTRNQFSNCDHRVKWSSLALCARIRCVRVCVCVYFRAKHCYDLFVCDRAQLAAVGGLRWCPWCQKAPTAVIRLTRMCGRG